MLLGITILSFFLGPFCHFSGGTIPTLNIGVNRLNGFCKKNTSRLGWKKSFRGPVLSPKHLGANQGTSGVDETGPRLRVVVGKGSRSKRFIVGMLEKTSWNIISEGWSKKQHVGWIFFRHLFWKMKKNMFSESAWNFFFSHSHGSFWEHMTLLETDLLYPVLMFHGFSSSLYKKWSPARSLHP